MRKVSSETGWSTVSSPTPANSVAFYSNNVQCLSDERLVATPLTHSRQKLLQGCNKVVTTWLQLLHQ